MDQAPTPCTGTTVHTAGTTQQHQKHQRTFFKSISARGVKNTEDAQLFSSRRWVDVTVNTVIGGWPIEEAKWETVGNYCTHRYASTYQCWKDEGCRYVGLCRTLHVPEWSGRGTNQYSGHMKSTQELHCLDDEDNLKGGWYYDRQNRHKFKKISYRTMKEKRAPPLPLLTLAKWVVRGSPLTPGQTDRPGHLREARRRQQ